MSVVNLHIQNKVYQLSCEAGDEGRIESLAAQLNTRLQELAAHAPGSSETMQMVMLMLMMQDELNEGATTQTGSLPKDHERTVSQAMDSVSQYLENLAKQLANR